MQRLRIDYQIKVEKIKRESFLFFFCFWILGYVFLLTMSNLGPYKYIEDILTSSMCNKNLLLGPNQTYFDSNSSIGCQFCKDFQRIDTKIFALKIKLLPIGNQNRLEKSSLSLKISKYSNKYYFIDNSCTKLNSLMEREHFPSINLDDSAIRKSFEEYYWLSEYQSKEFQAEFICKSDEFSLNMCNSNNFYEELGDQKNLAFYIEIKTDLETNKFNRALFEVIYENPKYYSFLNVFKCLFLGCTLFILIYSYFKLRNLQYEDWQPFHKWIVFLLIAQSLKDFPYLMIGNFIFEGSTYFIFLIISEFIYSVFLYTFWISIYEMTLNHLTFIKWHSYFILKMIIIMIITILNFALRFHLWDQHFQLNYLEDHLRKLLFDNFQTIHVGIYVIYIIYFLMLNYMSYGQLFRVDTSSLYGTIFILTSFIFVFNLIMEWRFYLSPLTISVFSYIAFNAVLNIYVYVFALLYVPQDFNSSKGQKFKEKDNEIINDVYGEELQEEEMKTVEKKEEDETKQKIWNQIEEDVKVEQQKFDYYDDEINKDEEEEDEDYIYV